jgi:hypothetical protein
VEGTIESLLPQLVVVEMQRFQVLEMPDFCCGESGYERGKRRKRAKGEKNESEATKEQS